MLGRVPFEIPNWIFNAANFPFALIDAVTLCYDNAIQTQGFDTTENVF